MSQRDLNRQISKATGEDIATIAGFGFVELRFVPFEREPLTIDWDEHDLDRNVPSFRSAAASRPRSRGHASSNRSFTLPEDFPLITISRQLVKHLRGVFRRMLPRSPSKADQTVPFVSGQDGLRVRLHNRAGAAEYRLAGTTHTETFAVTLDALSACEGTRTEENVILEAGDSDVVLRWNDRSIPRSIIVESQPTETETPAIPTEFGSNPSRLLTALKDAMETPTNPPINRPTLAPYCARPKP